MITAINDGKLTVAVEFTPEDWIVRVKALVSMVKSVDPSFMNRDDIYYTLCVVEDMLPTEEQAIEIFKR